MVGYEWFLPEMNTRYKLLSVSNFYIPKIKVEEDRLYVLAKGYSYGFRPCLSGEAKNL